MSCAREKPHRNVGEKNQDARLEGKTVGSERALIEPRLLMRLVQDEEEHARADQREVEEHEERVGDALAYPPFLRTSPSATFSLLINLLLKNPEHGITH